IERAILFVLVLERSLEPKFVLDDRAADRRIELPQFQSFVGRNDAESSILRRDVVSRPAGALVDLEHGAVKLIAALFRDDADLGTRARDIGRVHTVREAHFLDGGVAGGAGRQTGTGTDHDGRTRSIYERFGARGAAERIVAECARTRTRHEVKQ